MSSQGQAAGRKRTVHHLDTPYTTSWPEISQDDQDAILELLCSFLTPIGQHRKLQGPPSKGKRAAKKARKAALAQAPHPPTGPSPVGPPSTGRSELSSSVDVGLQSITRTLQAHASPIDSADSPQIVEARASHDGGPYAMVFVARGGQSSAFHCHFPQMVAACASTTIRSSGDALRLVGFSQPCSERLSSALGIPRVSSVAVRRTAPGVQALLAFVEKKVGPVGVPWMEGQVCEYRAARIASIETAVGTKRVRQS